MTREQAEDLLDAVIPRHGHPVTIRAVARVQRALRSTSEPEIVSCLRLLLLLLAEQDISLCEYLATANPEMWNDESFNACRTVHAALKRFAETPLESPATSGAPEPEAQIGRKKEV